MTQTNLRNAAIATATFACAILLSFWSAQRGISLSIESAQAQVDRPLTPVSVASVARRHHWRAAYAYGVVGASLAAGPWDYYGGSPCDYEPTGGGYYRGAGWDNWLLGAGACSGAGPW